MKAFVSSVFKDAGFSSKCDDIIKIKTSSDIKLSSAQRVVFHLH